MPVNLSVKNAPDKIVDGLRDRARRNHRSLQGEILAILEHAVSEPGRLTPHEVLLEIRELGLNSPSEAADIVREMRDAR